MANTVFSDEPQTVELLRSMRVLMRWLTSLPASVRQRCLSALAERSEQVQEVVLRMAEVVEDPNATPLERRQALASIADALLLKPEEGAECGQDLATSGAKATAAHAGPGHEVQATNCQEAAFAERLRELMTVKRVTQQELSQRVGCSQPAVSQMLNRKCRPQKKTILKLAEALQVQPHELWPDLEVAEMLDAVAGFQQENYVMTEAEAKALQETAAPNVPRIPVRPVPTRQR